MNVQYGCGLCAPFGWRNFDASPTLRLQKLFGRLIPGPRFDRGVEYGDIVKGLPIAPAACQLVYASHVLEHLSLTDFRTALKNTLSYLAPGGVFRLVVPDLEYLARQYLNGKDSYWFMQETALGLEMRPRRMGIIRSWLGNSSHLWMWDFPSMEKELREAGFGNIRRAQFNDSTLGDFQGVEDEGRWTNCLGVECTREVI